MESRVRGCEPPWRGILVASAIATRPFSERARPRGDVYDPILLGTTLIFVAGELVHMTHATDGSGLTDGREREERGTGADLDAMLDDPHCRYLLNYLAERDSPASVTEAARYVVGRLTDTPPEEVSEDVQRRVQTWLHHGQLPALDSHGVVTFDPDAGTVSLVGNREV